MQGLIYFISVCEDNGKYFPLPCEISGLIGSIVESTKEVNKILQMMGMPHFPGTTVLMSKTVKLPDVTLTRLKQFNLRNSEILNFQI